LENHLVKDKPKGNKPFQKILRGWENHLDDQDKSEGNKPFKKILRGWENHLDDQDKSKGTKPCKKKTVNLSKISQNKFLI
jgi:hypothetical protein